MGPIVHSFVPFGTTHRINNRFTAITSISTQLGVASSTTWAPSATTTITTNKKQKQILTFKEPKTNVTVVLIGSMHYNPTSIKLTSDTIKELGQSNKLGSVIIESCDIRWNKTQEVNAEKSIFDEILKSEMSTASDITIQEFGRPVILGDQRINITGNALKDGIKDALNDIFLPITGWKRFYNKLKPAIDDAVPTGPGYLDATSVFDLRLLLTTPVSFLKYPLSYLVRSPISSIIVLSFFFVLNALDPSTNGVMMVDDGSGESRMQISELLGSLAFAILETAVFARILIKELLAERNEILAKNILEQCKIYAGAGTSTTSSNSLFGLQLPSFLKGIITQGNDYKVDDTTEIVYVPNSNNIANTNDGEEKVVVAVLGMAHCNGIMKLLKEQRI